MRRKDLSVIFRKLPNPILIILYVLLFPFVVICHATAFTFTELIPDLWWEFKQLLKMKN